MPLIGETGEIWIMSKKKVKFFIELNKHKNSNMM